MTIHCLVLILCKEDMLPYGARSPACMIDPLRRKKPSDELARRERVFEPFRCVQEG